MPIMRKDTHSGAIIFDLTPEEEQVQSLQKVTAELQEQVKSLMSQLNPNNTGGDK